MKKPLENFLCYEDTSLIEGLKKIDTTSKGTIFVISRQGDKFLGTVTDGDIRRLLFKEPTLDHRIGKLVNTNCLKVEKGETNEDISAKIKSVSYKVRVLPVLAEGKCVDYIEVSPVFQIPVSSPALLGNEFEYVSECIMTEWISSQGKFINKFSEKFSEHYDYEHSIPVMNGTCALHIALVSLGIGPGDEVIVPSLTFAATINSVLHTGATPKIIDVEYDSWCMDPTKIEEAVNQKTKAIIPVHLFGYPANMTGIMKVANQHGLKVVEDCAQAIGAKHKDQYVGNFGDVGCFSFFANKIITTGEGGMCVTNQNSISDMIKKLRDHGRDFSKKGYFHDVVGYNYRMTNLQAAIGLAQLEKVDEHLNFRLNLQDLYREKLRDVKNLTPQNTISDESLGKSVCWLVSYLYEDSENRDLIIEKLKEQGIDARPFFTPLHLMPIYKDYVVGDCENARVLSEKGISFPTFKFKDTETIEKVCSILKSTL